LLTPRYDPHAPISTLFPYTTLFRSQRILLDDPGGGIEPAESTGEVPRVPHAAIRGDDDAVRPRCGSGCGVVRDLAGRGIEPTDVDRKSTRLNSSHLGISYAVFCLKK